MKYSVDPDHLASEKPADLDLHCFQNRIHHGIGYGFLLFFGCMSLLSSIDFFYSIKPSERTAASALLSTIDVINQVIYIFSISYMHIRHLYS